MRISIKRMKSLFTGILLILFLVIFYLTVQSYRDYDANNVYERDKNVVEHDKIIIGFSLGTLKEERWLKDRDILMAKVKELGADIIVQNANNDDQDQLKQVKYLVEQEIDVLVIVPNDLKKAATAVKLAKDQGVSVISYDRLVLDSDIDLYISFDNVKVGELMAQSIVEKVPEGNYLIINGPESDHNTLMIKEGYDKVLQNKIESGQISILDERQAPKWMKEHAFMVTDHLLQEGKEIDAIITGNDGLADGAIEALSEHRLAGKTRVVGQDADLAACQRVVEGTQLTTVYKPIDKLADVTAKMAIDLAMGKKINTEKTLFNGKFQIPYVILDPILVDTSNLEETIIKDGFHRRDDIYRNIP